MLEEVRSQRIQRRVFRLATIPGIDELFAELDLDPQSIDELRDLLADRGHVTSVVELCNGPFRRKRKIRNRTRFSDGSFPVFYSSLKPSTAEAEVRHWFPQYSRRPQYPRTGYFQRFSCIFDGVEKDLRPKIDEWPDLIHHSDYTFCNQLGTEAKSLQIDGLATWSARHEGTNVPIFERPAIGNPNLEGLIALTYYPDSGEVVVVDMSS